MSADSQGLDLERVVRITAAVAAIVVITVWNAVMRRRERSVPVGEPDDEPVVREHERGWIGYIRGYDVHHGAGMAATGGSFWRGLVRWSEGDFLRGYTIGDDVYLCPYTPRVVRVHQAGHAPSFGEAFEPLAERRREDGGLPDEPLRTADVMLPGAFPHTFLRLTDRRGLGGAYRFCLADGRIGRVRE
ncbi:hypothetical protein D8Y22_08420 [Salinadaptatus halalkaliphilus]|uniref:DUF4178 domain-containing protein n=1 Tax=Salinadaptatus halalkaliphilus TaxID=2419781 RepID=A0A4S3TRJ7_9EURY|nr:hypothetical protein [Salinadaptatus halalkaliphilus]THE65228.1 hypothetical protein D8Y22_08420 [Salinadaptatus halalkaliphilus]